MRETHETDDTEGESLPEWAQEMLSRAGRGEAQGRANPYAGATSGATAAIMQRVRKEPRPHRAAPLRCPPLFSPPMRASRWTRRGLLTPFGAAALAGVLGLMLSVRAVATLGGVGGASGMAMSAAVIGDTVMPSLGDRMRDTLRIVEFVLRGPSAVVAVRRADVVGDFNAWRRGATVMAQRADGTWYARVIVPRDAVRFAFAVNDEPVGIPAGPAGSPGAGRRSPPPVMRARIDSI
jgi:hypothetical protein